MSTEEKTQLFTTKGVSLFTFENSKWVKQGKNGKIKLWCINKQIYNDKFRIELQWIKSKKKTNSYWLIPYSYADKANNDKQCVVQYRIHKSELNVSDIKKSQSFTLALQFKNAEIKNHFKKCIFVDIADIYSMNEKDQQYYIANNLQMNDQESSVSYSESESWSIYDEHIKNKHSQSLSKKSNDNDDDDDNKDNRDNTDNVDNKDITSTTTKEEREGVLFLSFGGFEFAKTKQDLSLSHTDSYKRYAMLCSYDILCNDIIYNKFLSSLLNLESETLEYIELYNAYSKLQDNLSTWMCYRCNLENPNKFQKCRLCGDSINYYSPDKLDEDRLLIKIQHLIEPTNYTYCKLNKTLLTWIPSQFRIKLNKNKYYVTIKHEIDGLNNYRYKTSVCKYIRMIFAKMISSIEWINSMSLNDGIQYKLNIVVSLKIIYIPSNKIDSFSQFMHEGYKHECVDVVGLYFFDIKIPEQYESHLQIEFITSTTNDKVFSSTTKLKKERFDILHNGTTVVFNNKNNELFYRYKLLTKAYRYNDDDVKNSNVDGSSVSFKVLSFMMLGKKYNRDDIQRNVPDAPLKYRAVLEVWCRAYKMKIVDIIIDLILLYFKQRVKENNRNTRMKDTSLSSLLSTLS